jgi:hypothetical protein
MSMLCCIVTAAKNVAPRAIPQQALAAPDVFRISARSDQVESPGRKELAQDQLLEHDLFAKVVSTFGVHALARVPTRWNHLVEKNSRKINCLSMIFSQKWFPLLAFML